MGVGMAGGDAIAIGRRSEDGRPSLSSSLLFPALPTPFRCSDAGATAVANTGGRVREREMLDKQGCALSSSPCRAEGRERELRRQLDGR